MKHVLPLFLFFVLTVLSCTKETAIPEDTSDKYYPMQLGYEYVYSVTSIRIDKPTEIYDTVHYWLRQRVTDIIVDTLDYTTFVVQQDSCVDSSGWFPSKNIAVRKLDNEVVMLDNNTETVLLRYPISRNMYWDVNIYNLGDEKTYMYSDIDVPYQSEVFNSDSTIVVEQQKFESLYSYIFQEERYARGVGLCSKTDINIESQPTQGTIDLSLPIKERITYGYMKTYSLISYSLVE
ncbi:MAG: hypothetical protein PF481_03365 [Bacteroidales bacterium]|jgi:hypothetical protein|nr:hypothetical protein [Bacteroidales bacterium]